MISLKQGVRKLANFPRYGPAGLDDPQQQVRVWLRGLKEPLEVTYNNVVAALRPFTIGVMLPRGLAERLKTPLDLCMEERREPGRLLGSIQLRPVRRIELPEHCLCLFESGHFDNFCVGALHLRLYYWYEAWRAQRRQKKNPYNFLMTPEDIRCSHVFYLCPRPVVLVTVAHEGAGNMFPMDLIGPMDSPWFTMALRSTSPAVRLMQESGEMALASIPLAYKAAAYEMGKHHKKTTIDWDQLPFRTVQSPLFGLRVPEEALKVREVRVREFHEVGSHCLFITSIQRETLGAGPRSLQLFHRFSSYRQFLAG